MFDLKFFEDSSPDHPYWYKFTDIVIQTIRESGVNMGKVRLIWVPQLNFNNNSMLF